ncbi:hypothetical protein M885DRAFT_494766 [Pelagophyceae sp. CCMP2097]|nr:hypothetical protein M885DRAFT_494766 [Pelagophyceae sp. CCMP2097]
MLVALEYLATTPGLAVRRVKDRFSSPTAGGWADCLVNLEFVDDDELRGHVCELQFVHKTLYFVRDRMGAHHSYDVFRSAAELLEASGAVPNVPAEEGDEASELPAVLAPGTLDVSAFAKAVSAAVLAAIEPRLGALDARFSQFESRLESRVSRLERHFKAVEIQLGACLPPKAAEALQTSACRPLKATEALQASPPAGRPVPPKPRPASPVPPKPRPPPRPAENSKS